VAQKLPKQLNVPFAGGRSLCHQQENAQTSSPLDKKLEAAVIIPHWGIIMGKQPPTYRPVVDKLKQAGELRAHWARSCEIVAHWVTIMLCARMTAEELTLSPLETKLRGR